MDIQVGQSQPVLIDWFGNGRVGLLDLNHGKLGLWGFDAGVKNLYKFFI